MLRYLSRSTKASRDLTETEASAVSVRNFTTPLRPDLPDMANRWPKMANFHIPRLFAIHGDSLPPRPCSLRRAGDAAGLL
jgi:hypothetical protein